MTFLEMQTEVAAIIQDDSYADAIGGYINEAFKMAAGRVNLPDLKTLGIIVTVPGAMYVSLRGLPTGFSGRLSKLVYSPGDSEIDIYRNLENMVAEIQNQSRELAEVNPVEMIALEGQNLWYFPSPTAAQSIPAILFGNPPVLVNESDIPLVFPDHTHRKIGVHGACYMAYDNIEDGIEGAKVNTNNHFQLMSQGIDDLITWVSRHRQHHISSTLDIESTDVDVYHHSGE